MKRETRWTLLMLFVFLVWGSFFPVSRHIVADVHPLLLAFLRYFFGVLPLIPLFAREVKRSGMPTAGDMGSLFLLGMIGVTGFAVFIFYGIKLSNAMLSSLLGNTQPIFATLLAPLFTNERFTLRHLAGILIGIGGMSLVVTGGNFSAALVSDSMFLGNVLSVMAAVSISLYYIFLKAMVNRYGSVIPTFITFVSGGTILLALTLAAGADFSALTRLSYFEWGLVLYNGVIATALVYIINNKAISVIGVIRTIRLKFLVPVFGVLLSLIFLGERISPFSWAGMAVVLGATLFIQLSRDKAPLPMLPA